MTYPDGVLRDPRDGFERYWNPMRPWLRCPHCRRSGAVARRLGVKIFVGHRCPGPFVLDHVETDPSPSSLGSYRVTIMYRDYKPEGGEDHVCQVCRG